MQNCWKKHTQATLACNNLCYKHPQQQNCLNVDAVWSENAHCRYLPIRFRFWPHNFFIANARKAVRETFSRETGYHQHYFKRTGSVSARIQLLLLWYRAFHVPIRLYCAEVELQCQPIAAATVAAVATQTTAVS